ncbi:hypothetical protein CsatA_016849 [Cannabis sativa]
MVRTPCCDQNGMKKGTWTPEEDRKLVAYVTRYGCWNWRQLPKFAGLKRCGKSCRLRWMNYLRPNVKRGNYTHEEEETITRLHASLGNKWSAIAAELPGRTDNEVKNYWHTNLKKRQKQNSSSVEISQLEKSSSNSTASIITTDNCLSPNNVDDYYSSEIQEVLMEQNNNNNNNNNNSNEAMRMIMSSNSTSRSSQLETVVNKNNINNVHSPLSPQPSSSGSEISTTTTDTSTSTSRASTDNNNNNNNATTETTTNYSTNYFVGDLSYNFNDLFEDDQAFQHELFSDSFWTEPFLADHNSYIPTTTTHDHDYLITNANSLMDSDDLLSPTLDNILLFTSNSSTSTAGYFYEENLVGLL